jgi:hypothetical protein
MIKNDDDLREFLRGTLCADDVLLEEWTRLLKAGAVGAGAEGISRRIVDDFIKRVLLDEPQSKLTLVWLAETLDQVFHDGVDPKEAFRLPKRSTHRPKGTAVQKAIDVARWVKLAMDRGHPEPRANQLAADRFSCSARHVRRLRDDAAGWVDNMNPDFNWEEYFRLKGRPLPGAPGRKRSRRT